MTLRVVVVYPDLLGTYGDGGNGLVLARRAEWRGIEAELIQAPSDAPLPRGDLYCLGGGEDGPQAQAADALRRDGTLAAAVADGAVVLAVCAGFQIVGNSFPSAAGDTLDGLGLLDIDTAKGTGPRAVGELVAQPLDWGLPTLTGFENHAGTTVLGDDVRPLAQVEQGVGNGGGDHSEGAWSGRLIGTYLHGPVLARNPALADVLLGWATGVDTLVPLEDEREMLLRSERLGAARGARHRR
jgi:lipid II isoglutaminyl synthase (glutamine-hydrolysing)